MSITCEKLVHTYQEGTPFAYMALKGIHLQIEKGKMTALIGKTGSGKSTLVQHLNALLLPTQGSIIIQERIITANEKPKNLKVLRKQVGLVFQFPEYQLFEETIIKDVAFGPKNFGVKEEDALQKAKEALALVGIDASYYERSPFELSGGQKRRIAIAGILAMDPDILVLDEPTAGLDPQGAKEMMELFQTLQKTYNKTIILVTHDMEHVFTYCDDVVVMKDGNVVCKHDVNTFFQDTTILKDLNIQPPALIALKECLEEEGFVFIKPIQVMEDFIEQVVNEVNKG